MENIRESTDREINNFSEILNSLTEFIKDTWKGDIHPIERNHTSKFKGMSSVTATVPNFPDRLSKQNVALDIDQGREPIESLISSVLLYGILIGEERNKRKNKKEFDRLKERILFQVSMMEKGERHEIHEERINSDLDTFTHSLGIRV
jgi:hypothetical protein